VSLDKGMSHYMLVAYGHAFGTIPTTLLAFLFERLINPSLVVLEEKEASAFKDALTSGGIGV
jgi:hypothetical protein